MFLVQDGSGFTISTKYHNISQISQYQPNITILAKYHNISQISQYQPNITILTKFHNFSKISQSQSNITRSVMYRLWHFVYEFRKKLQYNFLKMTIRSALYISLSIGWKNRYFAFWLSVSSFQREFASCIIKSVVFQYNAIICIKSES